MTATTGRDQVTRAVQEVLGGVVPESEGTSLAPRRAFRDQLDMDSVDFLNFVLGLEARFGVRVAELDYPKVASLQGAVDYVLARCATAPVPSPPPPAR